MEIKYNIQGLLIYLTMAMYFLAIVIGLLKHKKAMSGLYFTGFIIAVISLIYRGVNVQHFPLQSMFEVFIFLGALTFPISYFSMQFLKIPIYISDMFVGVIILFPAGFIFSDRLLELPPALQSFLFVPHVLVYMLSYVILTKAAILATKQLSIDTDYESNAYKLVCFGFPFLTAGLILGSIWAKLAWGDYWGWDPKELWSLATWLVYGGYFHYRAMYPNNKKNNSIWIISGFVFIIITILWVNLSRLFTGMHNYAS